MELIHTWFHFPEFRCVFALFCSAAECEDNSPRGIDRCENALLQAAISARIIHPVYCTNPRGCVGFFCLSLPGCCLLTSLNSLLTLCRKQKKSWCGRVTATSRYPVFHNGSPAFCGVGSVAKGARSFRKNICRKSKTERRAARANPLRFNCGFHCSCISSCAN